MKLRYFVVGRTGLLRKVSQAGVQGLWDGRRSAAVLGCPGAHELRLLSVVCDDDLLPTKVYVLRLPLTDGCFTGEDRLTLHLFAMPDCVTSEEMLQHHTDGWPADLFFQLAVALDVPVASLHVPVGVGGPLFTAAAMQLTPQQALRYLR
jgi:hypothetical protein